jgi:competence protein ComEC
MSKKEILVIVTLLLIGIFRFFYLLPTPLSYDNAVGRDVVFTGLIVDAPDKRVYNHRLTVQPMDRESNILVVIPVKNIYNQFHYGDQIKVWGQLKKPENFTTNSGKSFDYIRYLKDQDIYYILEGEKVEIIARNQASKLKYYLFKIRDAFMQSISRYIKSSPGDLANGLLLGSRGGFSEDLKDKFIKTGTIHIVALSGYNVTIVAESISKIFNIFLSAIISSYIAIIFIFLFVIMSGGSATAIRAGLMACIAIWGKIAGREYDAKRALFIAGVLMLVYDFRLLFNMSFQLSFLATFGVLFINEKIKIYFMFITHRLGLRDLISTTLSAMIATLPLLLYSTGLFSVVALPANVLILPFIPIAMLFSFLTGVFSFVFPLASLILGYVSSLPLGYMIKVVEVLGSVKFASFNVSNFSLYAVFFCYVLIFYWGFSQSKTK